MVKINHNQTFEEFIHGDKKYYVFREYYKTGQLSVETTYCGNYIGKNKNGYMKKWYLSGALKMHIDYANNKKHGTFQTWYENGQLQKLGEYCEGNRIGIWKYWYKNGKILHEQTYSSTDEVLPE
jgi:antitoxin component YwqK of YwqJK toxin-antitoxin module